MEVSGDFSDNAVPTAAGAEHGRRRILIIEDDQAIVEMYSIRLRLEGYEVITAGDGRSAMRLIAQSQPDVIYLDVRMPDLDGLEVLEAIGRDLSTARVPVIMLSNYSEPRIVARALGLGAKDFLVKSRTTPGELAENARSWMRQTLPEVRAG